MKIQSMRKSAGRNFEYDKILYKEIQLELSSGNSKVVRKSKLSISTEFILTNEPLGFFPKNCTLAEIIF